MLLPRVADILTVPQSRRWSRLLEACAAMAGGNDPVLFHGTSALRAAAIRKDGFEPSLLSTPSGALRGVHWGVLDLAKWAAESKMEADDPPAIAYARLSSILASGEPYADVMYEDETSAPLADWRDGLRRTGSVCVAGGRHVEGLRHASVLGLAFHPRAAEVRTNRLAGRMNWPGTPTVVHIPDSLVIGEGTAFADESDVDVEGCLIWCPEGAAKPGGLRLG